VPPGPHLQHSGVIIGHHFALNPGPQRCDRCRAGIVRVVVGHRPGSRTRAASFGCTSSTRSPAATSCRASMRPSPPAPSAAHARSGQATEPASHARDPDRGAGGSGLCGGPGDVTGARRGGAGGIRGVWVSAKNWGMRAGAGPGYAACEVPFSTANTRRVTADSPRPGRSRRGTRARRGRLAVHGGASCRWNWRLVRGDQTWARQYTAAGRVVLSTLSI